MNIGRGKIMGESKSAIAQQFQIELSALFGSPIRD